MADSITFKILEDGTIVVTTSEISSDHMSADELLTKMDKLMGGKVTIEEDPDADHGAHDHDHAHSH